LQELGNIILIHREAEVSLDNFKRLMDTPIDYKPAKPALLGDLNYFEFKNVSFKHQTANNNALSDVSFRVNKGETIAFVGPSGSGKTTLVKLLVGLYQPAIGNILYDGIDAKEINLDELREKIGFVTQDTQLFSGTIRENILFPRPDASAQRLEQAVKAAHVHEFTDRFEQGLDTLIGERGVKLSGGQRQRIAIARAILADPRILILDEATSNLDTESETLIQASLKELMQGRTTFVIAHRLSTIRQADQILVIEQGQIVERGKHEELLAKKGRYFELYTYQARI
jgi:subfamily B ATP-binding cassette protein MsbA